MMDFTSQKIAKFIAESLAEDKGSGDHSSLACIPEGKFGAAQMIFKENGIVAGLKLAEQIFHTVDPNLKTVLLKHDGDEIKAGEIILYVSGSVHSILVTERLVLNCIQRLSGIATQTHQAVKLIKGTKAKILDTRKTTPGLRHLEKWAVRVGGGVNHRMGLYDMIMLKDNHIDYAGGIGVAVERTKQYLSKHNLSLKIEVETRNLEEVKQALEQQIVDRIMFDNFSPELMKAAVLLVDGRKQTEASGGITLQNVRKYAETGVDFISIGALTHSVRSIDISLKEIEQMPNP